MSIGLFGMEVRGCRDDFLLTYLLFVYRSSSIPVFIEHVIIFLHIAHRDRYRQLHSTILRYDTTETPFKHTHPSRENIVNCTAEQTIPQKHPQLSKTANGPPNPHRTDPITTPSPSHTTNRAYTSP